MSKFVDEIIKELLSDPNSWTYLGDRSVKKGSIRIVDSHNPRFLAVIWVYVNEKECNMNYFDNWKLHVAVSKWRKIVDLKTLTQ